jgi:hypothetical protein
MLASFVVVKLAILVLAVLGTVCLRLCLGQLLLGRQAVCVFVVVVRSVAR